MVELWLSQLETHKLPLVPVLTTAMPKQAVAALEQASNVRQEIAAKNASEIIVKGMQAENVFRANPSENHDISSISNSSNRKGVSKPRLGDRVVNLTARSVPFGIRGTVVAIHPGSGCVEIVFDVEFVGGTTLNEICSNYRGKLLPWSSLYTVLSSAKKNTQSQPKKGQSKTPSAKSSGRSRTPTPKKQQSQPKKILQKPSDVDNSFNALPPSVKIDKLMNRSSQRAKGNPKPERRDELEISDAETSGTTSYFQQLQHQAQSQDKKQAPSGQSQTKKHPPIPTAQSHMKKTTPLPKKSPMPSASVTEPPLAVPNDEQQQFQNLLNRAFKGRTVQPPPPFRANGPLYEPYAPNIQNSSPPDTQAFPTLGEAKSIPRGKKVVIKSAKPVVATKGNAGGLLMPTQILHKKYNADEAK